jgi:hypothetical protein
MTPGARRSAHNAARTARLLVFLLHALVAAAWIYFMAGGFPLMHLRFLANRAIPLAVLVTAIVAIYADQAGRKALLNAITLAMAAGWLVASVTGIALFPISARFLLPIGLMISLTLFLLRVPRSDLQPRWPRPTLVTMLLGGCVGLLLPFTQRAPLPTTRPLNLALSNAPAQPAASVPELAWSNGLRVASASGTISWRRGEMLLVVNPLLTFVSRSPDRCWTLFAPRSLREWPERKLTLWARNESAVELRYANLGITDLSVSAAGDDQVNIEAISHVPQPVYSHLNSYCEFSLIGHTKLSLAFSPCADKPIDVLPSDYPVGRPARFAYLDAGGSFRVVEASSGEKGPFHELASGKLPRGQALVITLLDTNRPIGSIALADWSAQLSADLSPTAGWGVPQNAIEFSLGADSPRSNASIFISLAATSVGRGFDSVGHAPGVYRNRLTLRLPPP